jgi:type II secretory ATPase GspE/PulE/Tfp pilus assembly ATPase PilB-like protein
MIAKSATASELRSHASANGMLTLREAALIKAEHGVTSLEEVIRETAS